MSINKLALIRYKTIDQCLSNRFRKWTMNDLIEKVAEALYDFEGITSGVSRRTIQLDLQLMRSDKLGYNAPIIVVDKKYYTYEDKNYTITKSPLSENDMGQLKEMIDILKQMNGFEHFFGVSDVVLKLENSLLKNTTERGKSYIQFETNSLLKGIELINPLYNFIARKQTILIEYKSFKAQKPQQLIVYPYLLKEYRNRWFLICKEKNKNQLTTLALDRMIGIQKLIDEKYSSYTGVSFDRYFEDVLGVTKSEKDRGFKIVFWLEKRHVPYILTKPIHATQQLLSENEDGSIFSIQVVLNFELEREILGYGSAMKILGPRFLQSRIKKNVEKTLSLYTT